MRNWLCLLCLLGCAGGCSDRAAAAVQDGAASADTASGDAAADERGKRYCEVLLGTFGADAVHLDVYSTEGLNTCPDAAWSSLDPAALKAANAVDLVVLNGPRYWMLDSLAGSSLQDTAVRAFAGIDMRKAGAIDIPNASLTTMSKPYVQHTIHRNSSFHWSSGLAVFELHDDAGHVYAMQSFSAQKQPLTQADLPDLAKKLTLPTGWTFAPRVLTAALNLAATDGNATVVQDDLGNTYSLAQ